MLLLISISSCLTGPQLWPSGSSTTWSVHNCAKFSQLNFLQPPILLIHLGSIPKWILHSILKFRTGRATVESHGSRPVFQMPWERGIWRRIFNPHPSPLSILSHSIPLDSSSFQIIFRSKFFLKSLLKFFDLFTSQFQFTFFLK